MKKLEELKGFQFVAWFLVISFAIFTLALIIRVQQMSEGLAIENVI